MGEAERNTDNVAAAGEPPRMDWKQALTFFSMLYEEGDWFHILVRPEKGADALYKGIWVEEPLRTSAGKFAFPAKRSHDADMPGFVYYPAIIENTLRVVHRYNAANKLHTAASVAVYAFGESRTAEQSVAIPRSPWTLTPRSSKP